MTLKQAIRCSLKIEPGNRINTLSGWVRADRIFLGGIEIGCIQTRRAMRRTESLTIARLGQVRGYDIDWLVKHAARSGDHRSAA
jgi:hypothetical protein